MAITPQGYSTAQGTGGANQLAAQNFTTPAGWTVAVGDLIAVSVYPGGNTGTPSIPGFTLAALTSGNAVGSFLYKYAAAGDVGGSVAYTLTYSGVSSASANPFGRATAFGYYRGVNSAVAPLQISLPTSGAGTATGLTAGATGPRLLIAQCGQITAASTVVTWGGHTTTMEASQVGGFGNGTAGSIRVYDATDVVAGADSITGTNAGGFTYAGYIFEPAPLTRYVPAVML